jgi:hypothetical protein
MAVGVKKGERLPLAQLQARAGLHCGMKSNILVMEAFSWIR